MNLSLDYTVARLANSRRIAAESDWRPPEGTAWEVTKHGIRGLNPGIYILAHSKLNSVILTSLVEIEGVPKNKEFVNMAQWEFLVDRGYVIPYVHEPPDWRSDSMIPEDFYTG